MKLIQKILLSPFFSCALIVTSFAIRYLGLKFISWDLRTFVFPWYEFISEHGIWNSLRESFSNYTPPYLYLLGLASWTRPFLNRISAIKLIPLVFDIYNAYMIYRIVRLKYRQAPLAMLAGSLAFLLPTVILNSAYWGQVDSIYTAFLLTCLYSLLTDRPGWAFFFFGIAFATKFQSIFLLPFLTALTLQRKISWKYYLLIPLIYLVMVFPAALAGRPWGKLLTIYLGQAENTAAWSRNAANPYVYMPLNVPAFTIYVMLSIAAILTGLWIYLTAKRSRLENPGQLLLAALASLSLLPYILPRMHDRYFYPADVFSLVVAFYNPRLWFLPLLFQIGSYLVYDNYLYGVKASNLPLAVAANTLALVIILAVQFRKSGQTAEG